MVVPASYEGRTGRTSALQSAPAHAFERRMSNGQSWMSTPIEWFSASSAGAELPANRPPQSLCDEAAGGFAEDEWIGRTLTVGSPGFAGSTDTTRSDCSSSACAACGDNPTITELIDYDAFCGAVSEAAADAAADATISVATLDQWLKERENGERDFVLVDVREPNEYEINKIPGSVLIPKGEFLNGNALSQLPQDKQIVLHCKVGGRSAEALAVVKGAGYADAVHVGGGVVAWVSQIDPSQPTY